MPDCDFSAAIARCDWTPGGGVRTRGRSISLVAVDALGRREQRRALPRSSRRCSRTCVVPSRLPVPHDHEAPSPGQATYQPTAATSPALAQAGISSQIARRTRIRRARMSRASSIPAECASSRPASLAISAAIRAETRCSRKSNRPYVVADRYRGKPRSAKVTSCQGGADDDKNKRGYARKHRGAWREQPAGEAAHDHIRFNMSEVWPPTAAEGLHAPCPVEAVKRGPQDRCLLHRLQCVLVDQRKRATRANECARCCFPASGTQPIREPDDLTASSADAPRHSTAIQHGTSRASRHAPLSLARRVGGFRYGLDRGSD